MDYFSKLRDCPPISGRPRSWSNFMLPPCSPNLPFTMTSRSGGIDDAFSKEFEVSIRYFCKEINVLALELDAWSLA